MIIFITIPWFLPAYRAGGPVQSIANLVNNFSNGVEYYIFCSCKDLNGEPINSILNNQWVAYNDITKVWYDSGQCTRANMLREYKKVKPDVLYIIGIFSWQYAILPLLFCKAAKKILSIRGMLHPGALSQKIAKKQLYLFAFKTLQLYKQLTFQASDEQEATYIKQQFGSKVAIQIAGNFAKAIEPSLPIKKMERFLKMITVALISPMKNHLLVLQALQHCTAHIEYTIIGPIKDEAYWALCKQHILLLPTHIKVWYKGEVSPAQVATELAASHIFIMPSLSENFGHAIAEALSAGKPVITSHFTPWNNLQQQQAGINVHNTVADILQAIQYYAALPHSEYLPKVTAAVAYVKHKINKQQLFTQHQQLFSLT